MNKLTSSQIRDKYLTFFKEHNHDIYKSASLVPVDDPSLLWINSGVATMKKFFDGSVIPPNPRITSSQKSIRTNDIENVGKTARHLTFFEMLGNFSVGDYFKDEIIPWAWEFLTSPKWLGLDPDKLYVTVYPKDEVTKDIWLNKVGIPADHIYEDEDNFWDIGIGPCGPDSEIFYDRGQNNNDVAEDDPENYPGGENSRYLEIWNLVFSEFNHNPDGTYTPQPHKNIDTGMGFERIVSVIQDAPTNFETDLFIPVIEATEKLSNHKYGQSTTDDVDFKIIADHLRTLAFAIGDGALPSNEGRGYVLRRLLRRAVLSGNRLGISGEFLSGLVPIIADGMQDTYPEIKQQQDFIQKVISKEERRFGETLNEGLALLNKVIVNNKQKGKSQINGADAFKLFDTYGFPVELTTEYAEMQNQSVDKAGFDAAMAEQKERARNARVQDSAMGTQNEVLLDLTDESTFVYNTTEIYDSGLLDIIQNNKLVDHVGEGEALLLFEETPFYTEMGGQISDTGLIYQGDNLVAKVHGMVKAPNGQSLHEAEIIKPINKGDKLTLKVDQQRRELIENNHTATHLLDQTLKDVLGEHVHQAGSLVTDEYLRFDFNNLDKLTTKQLNEIEKVINQKILDRLPVSTIETTLDKAKEIGAIALFDNKYGENVRVVSVGDYSIELCGGTHVSNTSELGQFVITSESGIGSGIRRIEARTSKGAYEYQKNQAELLGEVKQTLKAPSDEAVPGKVTQLKQELKNATKTNTELINKMAGLQMVEVFKNSKDINGVTVIAATLNNLPSKELRTIADNWKNGNESDVLILATNADNKVGLLVAANKAAQEKGIQAGSLIKEIAPIIGGKGGGRPDLAQAGGSDTSKINDALSQAESIINSI